MVDSWDAGKNLEITFCGVLCDPSLQIEGCVYGLNSLPRVPNTRDRTGFCSFILWVDVLCSLLTSTKIIPGDCPKTFVCDNILNKFHGNHDFVQLG